ncbi:Crp/Fnr family transcriptional regulator [Methylobacterium sp. J-070]|uniref:Crp/Fnr family transcriptional regulator n=1 Tax=Methylobacterium sp. J-070 TaxID=2836650 RepID=UPI001FBBE6A3|nr:Crp/Fnr family transcriptional regulator [Methylobacterium sp. J-070]MCJ2049649.1 Crp/Fnr family transcriptional regulator [Methylobacterium sp. J-070]
MSNALIRKLDHAGGLTDADRATLLGACASPRPVAAGQDLTCEGDPPENVHLILRGFAYRYKILPGGKRQITAVFVPGDFCDLHVAILQRMDHSIATLLPCEVVYLSRATVVDLTAGHPRIARALWWATLVDEAILRAWLVNIGQREASRQIAHLFCELHARLDAVGLATRDNGGAAFDTPLRQTDLADLLGMTPVHVNRMLQELREAGLIVLKRRRLQILDLARLRAFCGFDAAYLHLENRPDRR